MKKNESMKKIEQLLELAPEVKDTRTKEELFARLKKEGAFDEKRTPQIEYEKPVIQERNGNRLATFTVAVLAFITFGGIGGFLLSHNQSEDDASSGANEAMLTDRAEMDTTAERSISPFTEDDEGSVTNDIPQSSLVWESDLQWANQLKVGLVTEQLEVVPATVLIDRHQIAAETDTYLKLYDTYASQFDEEALGFIPYHPLAGELKEGIGQTGEVLEHFLPDGHSYDMSSATEALYSQVLHETFYIPFSQVRVVGKDGAPIGFAHMGKVDTIQLENQWQDPYFVVETGGKHYLAPLRTTGINNIEQALLYLMEEPQNKNFFSPILEGIAYTAVAESDAVIITFTEPLQLADYAVEDRVLMFDALIMTAANYGMQVQFENVVDTENNQYPLSQLIEKPIGINKIILK